ncbi:T9SS type B sorting domain-containing protein [Ohtaekwangia koreensis]|uniref:Gliding motility-associated C-terminal domain-containing protein n=1 Tax=Ohtaekwangia koreensis TaxID=688867 RepID=A0A1T5L9D8_9BACT|nr:gliding motility-associated C-terminal domain-containing protein [Ohtaekwangia koreensis]SKC72305.1 gliding motility-associated C-terminal domain-containing protein [Ohtaekwangia koreensis]
MYSYSLPALLLFLLVNVVSVLAQEIMWAHQSEDVAYDEGVFTIEMELDADENLYVLYVLQGRVKFEGVQFESAGTEDLLLIKYNPEGNILWIKQIGGDGWDSGSDMAIDSDNNVLITGVFSKGSAFLDPTLDPNNGSAFIAKLNLAGDLIWVRQYGNQNSAGHAITSDRFNNIIVGGFVDMDNLLVAAYDSNGILMWSEPMIYMGCCVQPSIEHIRTDASNNIIIIGDFTGRINFAGETLQAPFFYSAFIYKLKSDGSYIWSNQVDPTEHALDDARGVEVQIDQMGDIFMLGYFNGAARLGTITLKAQNDIDDRTGFLTKISSEGSFLWAKTMYSDDMLPGSLNINPNTNELNICGSSGKRFAYDDDYVSSSVTKQSFILTTDATGNFKRYMFLNPESYPSYRAHAVFNSKNEFYITSNFYADFTVGCFDMKGGSWYTAFLIKSGKLPDIAISNLKAICVDNVVEFEAKGADLATSFTWYFPEGIESTSGSFVTTLPSIAVKINEYKENTSFTVVPYFECYPRTEFSASLKMARKPEQPERPTGPALICAGVSSIYTTSQNEGVDKYIWTLSSNVNTIAQAANQVNVIALLPNATATIQVKAENGCGESQLSETLTVVVSPEPSAPIITGPSELCAGQSNVQYMASATNANSYDWIISPSGNVKKLQPDNSVITVDFPKGIHAVTIQAVSKGLCKNSTSQPLIVELVQPPLVPTEIAGNAEFCIQTESVIFVAQPEQSNVSYTWSYPVGFSVQSSVANTLTLNLTDRAEAGEVSVTVFNRCFTSVSKQLSIKVLRAPEKPLIAKSKCDRQLLYEGDYDDIAWYKDNALMNEGVHIVELASGDSGYYHVEVQNVCGKTQSDILHALPVYMESIFIPNVLTANDDGYNDYFVVDKSLKGSSLKVVNRWGERVYYSERYDNTWNGQDLSFGTYFYTIRNECTDRPISGYVHLMK